MSLATSLARVLGDTFVMATHAHIAHWNVTGPDFMDKHAYLGGLYEDLAGATDGIAEHIRVGGPYAPATLAAIVGAAEVPDRSVGNKWEAIRSNLARENEIVLVGLRAAFDQAIADRDEGTADFLAGRLDVHAKHAWFLAASR